MVGYAHPTAISSVGWMQSTIDIIPTKLLLGVPIWRGVRVVAYGDFVDLIVSHP